MSLLHVTFIKRRPLHIDLGCGDGRHIVEWSKAHADVSWLGLDLHAPSHGRAHGSAEEAAPSAAAFLVCNCHQLAVLGRLIERLRGRGLPLSSVSIVLPRQWTKARHAARRLLSASLLELLHTCLTPGGRLLVVCADGARADDARTLLSAVPGRWREVVEDVFPLACGAVVGTVVEVRVMRV